MLFAGAFPDRRVVDRATEAFGAMIAAQAAAGATAGDHFAAPGANDRVWGALDKLALRDPELFADYYANDVLALVAQAWLGPGYQVTSQVNVVNPGGRRRCRTGTTTSGSCPPRRRRGSRRTCTGSPRPHPAGCGRAR